MNERGRVKDEDLEALRQRISLVEIAADHLQLRRVGRRVIARCPFHDEKTASFSIEPTKNLYHCFGCGEGGDAFTFVQKIEGLDFHAAVEKLAGRFGVTLRYEELSPRRREEMARKRAMVEALSAAATYFHETLKRAPEAAEARRYLLEQRGFTTETLETFQVGFSLPSRTALIAHLRKQGFADDVLVTVNVAIRGDDGEPIDRFRGRVMFPIRDRSGDVIGFGARRMGDDPQSPKYLNTSETPLYRKSEVLYGLDRASRTIVRDDTAILVEGYTDVIALHAAGIENAVAACGTAVGADHLLSLRRFATQLVVCLDADAAGLAAAERMFAQLGPEAEARGLALRAVVVPGGADPADVVQRDGPEAFRAILDRAIPLVELVLMQEAARYGGGDAQQQARALQTGLKHLARVRDPVVVRAAARSFADRIGVDPAVLFVELNRIRAGGGVSAGGAETVLKRSSAQVRREQTLLKLAAQRPELLAHQPLDSTTFTIADHRAVWDALRAGVEPATIEDPEVRSGVTAAHVAELEGVWDDDSVAALVASCREASLSRRIDALRATLEKGAASDEVFAELMNLEQERRTIREEVRGAAST